MIAFVTKKKNIDLSLPLYEALGGKFYTDHSWATPEKDDYLYTYDPEYGSMVVNNGVVYSESYIKDFCRHLAINSVISTEVFERCMDSPGYAAAVFIKFLD